MNTQVNLVTQSVQGTTKAHLQATVNPALPVVGPSIAVGLTGNFTLKFSLEKMQVRADSTIKISLDKPPLGGSVATKIIFDASKSDSQLVILSDVEVLGQSHKNCTAITIQKLPPVPTLQADVNAAIKALQGIAKCSASDGTYDTWSVSSQDVLPIPNLTATVDAKMDKNYLWREVDLGLPKLHLENITEMGITINSLDGTGSATVSATSATADGPTASDLDHSTWGQCTPVVPPLNKAGISAVIPQITDAVSHRLLAVILSSLDEEIVV